MDSACDNPQALSAFQGFTPAGNYDKITQTVLIRRGEAITNQAYESKIVWSHFKVRGNKGFDT